MENPDSSSAIVSSGAFDPKTAKVEIPDVAAEITSVKEAISKSPKAVAQWSSAIVFALYFVSGAVQVFQNYERFSFTATIGFLLSPVIIGVPTLSAIIALNGARTKLIPFSLFVNRFYFAFFRV